MSTSASRIGSGPKLSARAIDVTLSDAMLSIRLEDGRGISVPLAWFPRLAEADEGQRKNWELVGRGIGIHWPAIDEDISVENLLGAEGEILAYRNRAAPEASEPTPEALEDELLETLPKTVDLMDALKTSIQRAKRLRDADSAS